MSNTVVYGIENVTITLDLANNLENNVIYNVSVIPEAQIMLIGNTRAQLIVLYNTQYRVSIVTSHRCSRNQTTIELNYGKLKFPLTYTVCLQPLHTYFSRLGNSVALPFV